MMNSMSSLQVESEPKCKQKGNKRLLDFPDQPFKVWWVTLEIQVVKYLTFQSEFYHLAFTVIFPNWEYWWTWVG